MKIGRFEHGTDANRRRLQMFVGTSKYGRVTAGGFGQAQQHSECRRFSRSVGPEKTGNGSRLNGEREVLDREHVTVAFCQRITLNDERHGLTFALRNMTSLIHPNFKQILTLRLHRSSDSRPAPLHGGRVNAVLFRTLIPSRQGHLCFDAFEINPPKFFAVCSRSACEQCLQYESVQ